MYVGSIYVLRTCKTTPRCEANISPPVANLVSVSINKSSFPTPSPLYPPPPCACHLWALHQVMDGTRQTRVGRRRQVPLPWPSRPLMVEQDPPEALLCSTLPRRDGVCGDTAGRRGERESHQSAAALWMMARLGAALFCFASGGNLGGRGRRRKRGCDGFVVDALQAPCCCAVGFLDRLPMASLSGIACFTTPQEWLEKYDSKVSQRKTVPRSARERR
jgi:hypothetical protein